ncbi:MAG: hypothetical protein JRI23_07675 [Deltaproteobacteria bacterium]|jgi:hypothetical protein|nr:hypothetical protein [Deltaproteobacteria bacterium]MBW2531484.1 hypothetical protein [Deltaproteobacteria bacterium]
MAGKHFQLVVANYDQQGSSPDGPPLSYFRLGAAVDENDADEPLRDKTVRGDDLVDNRTAADPTDPRLRFKDDWRGETKPGKTYYRDDGVDAATPGSAASGPIDLSKELIRRGGWREHTDGNRISTTRGDCVEVIGGNYKLIVLGRVAETWDPAGLGEANNPGRNVGRTRQEISSGGHYNESTSTPGEVVSITWTDEHEDGTWTTIEQTDHGDVKSIYKGYIEDYYFGPSIQSYVGKKTEKKTIEANCDTGARSSADGHEEKKPDITETTYARSIKKQEHYDVLAEKTTILGTGEKRDELHVKKAAHSKAVYKKITSIKRQCFFKESLCAIEHTVNDGFSGWRRNYTLAGITLNLSLIPLTLTMKWGVKIGFTLAETFSLSGAGSATLNLGGLFIAMPAGKTLDLAFGASTTIDILHLEVPLNNLSAALFKRKTHALNCKSTSKRHWFCGVKKDG